jgi:hypothetical protein
MNTELSVTETVVRNHLQAFLEQKGIAAILNDYDENARFYSEAKIYHGKREIHGFFVDFIGSLPAGGIDHFSLRSRHVDGNIAYITWSVGSNIPLGIDTLSSTTARSFRKRLPCMPCQRNRSQSAKHGAPAWARCTTDPPTPT